MRLCSNSVGQGIFIAVSLGKNCVMWVTLYDFIHLVWLVGLRNMVFFLFHQMYIFSLLCWKFLLQAFAHVSHAVTTVIWTWAIIFLFLCPHCMIIIAGCTLINVTWNWQLQTRQDRPPSQRLDDGCQPHLVASYEYCNKYLGSLKVKNFLTIWVTITFSRLTALQTSTWQILFLFPGSYVYLLLCWKSML